MKKLIKQLARIVFFTTFIIFVISTVALASLLILKNNEYLRTLESYNITKSELDQTSDGLNQTSQEKQDTINQLNSQIISLKDDNKELKSTIEQLQQTGQGIIQGKISGQIILGQDNLSQYQLVCAQNVANASDITCKSVSAITQTFEIALPAGQYNVYAKVLDKQNQISLSEYTGKYTEYVKCLTEKATGPCDATLSKKQIKIEVKSGQKTVNVNPVDWN